MKPQKRERECRRAMEERLSGKGISCEYIADSQTVEKLKGDWIINFVPDVVLKTNDIYIDRFLWHVFSYGKRACLSGEKAVTAFLSQNKSQCYIFFQHHDDAYYLENAENLSPADFAGLFDVYVTSQRFNWTYVLTHESDLGPYFYHKKM